MRPLLRGLLTATLLAAAPLPAAELHTATFAGGCFWCVEQAFDEVDGVVSTTSGYANGRIDNPSYDQVSAGGTGYVEALQLQYDPAKVRYERLLEVFWKNHDPTDGNGQFCDRGNQYRPAIFYHNDAQREAAQSSLAELRKEKPFAAPIITPIEPLEVFYPAEAYHQNYHQKNPIRYNFYKYSCGRPSRLEELWGE
jgi:peptide-methionine (S)-S-oxide reductase